MIDRRTALLTGLSLLGLGGLSQTSTAQTSTAQTSTAQTSNQDRADLARIEAYLNSVRSLKARFMQTAPNGGVTEGIALMQRPGKMRFQYDPPSPFLLIANYGILFFQDAQLGQTTNIPLSRTPLGILLGDHTSLSGEVAVTKFVRLPGQLQVTLIRSASPGEGSLTLMFADNPLTLRQWVVVDQQGKQTRVTFTNMEVGAAVDAKLFDYRNPSAGASGG